jgi:DNA-binding response OmpR family regulator
MVVDDNPANLKLLEEMLRQQRFEVQSFPLGRLALAAAEQEPPDLILLDVNMPQMDGYEVCARLKSNHLLSDIPVIFISALNETGDKVKGFQSGAADYVSKPFQFEEVQARIETHLKLRRALQA